MNKKNLIYGFAEIPWVIQTSILNKCGLLSEDVKDKRYIEFIDKIIEKAEQLNCLDKLENEVDRHYLNRLEDSKTFKYSELNGRTLMMKVIDNEDGLIIGGTDVETGKTYIIFSKVN